MATETDPPGFRLVPACTCPNATKNLHVIRDTVTGAVRIDWQQGAHVVHGMACYTRCGMPLRIEAVL